jgi:response regulator RpfG family c-di-GMP phosphodiesterase
VSVPLRVLILEDRASDAELMTHELERAGYTLDWCRTQTPDEFLARLDPAPDIVLADYVLPNFDAPGALRLLQERNLDIPFIVVTGSISEEVAVECIKQGAADYILKDRMTRLGPAVARALQEKKTRDEKRAAEQSVHRLLEQTRRRAEQLAAINTLGNALAETLEQRQILERVCQAATQLLPDLAAVRIFLLDSERQSLTLAFETRDGTPSTITNAPPIPVHTSAVGTPGEAVRTRRAVIAQDFTEAAAVRAALHVPMFTRGKVVGVLSVYSHEHRLFHSNEADLMQLIANAAATAIENAHLFADIERRLSQLQTLHDIDRAITASIDMQVTLDLLVRRVHERLGAQRVEIHQFNPHFQTLRLLVGTGTTPYVFAQTEQRLSQAQARPVVLERRALVVPATQSKDGLGYYAFPLIAKGYVKGVLELYFRPPRTLEPEWREFVDTIAAQAAIAIDNSELFTNLQQANFELALSYDATIGGWARALDLRTRETPSHTARVTDLSERLAQRLDIPNTHLVHVHRGALLHDIGMLGVPETILFKPAALNEEEWKIVRQHPIFARDLIQPIAYLRPALDIPYCHHEKWDGTGYPRGLKGEEIPLAARVFAVIDVYDALTSPRPYRAAWSEEQARAYIQEQAGKHFDPRVVEEFLRMQSETRGVKRDA